MRPLVVDTSTWIDWARGHKLELLEQTRRRVVLMPAVVSMELLSGARDRRSLAQVNALLRPFLRHRRVVVPTYDDFALTGELLAQLGWAASKRANDVLIVVTARRVGAAVMTSNVRDFAPACRLLEVELA